MEDFDFTLALHDAQLPVRIHPYEADDRTYYNICFQDHSISIYKDNTLHRAIEDKHDLSKDDMQSIGEQIYMREYL